MFNKMKIYTVHIKPGQSGAAEKPVFIREGYNIMALAFHALWALYHRLWLAAIMLIVANVIIISAGKMQIISPDTMIILQLTVQVLAGFHGNDWLRSAYTKRGYIMADISTGDSLLRAEQRYFERYLANTARG